MKKIIFLALTLFAILLLSQSNDLSLYYGAIKEDIPKQEKYIYSKVSLPNSYSVPITSVKDQIPCPSCTAFASISAFESYLLLKGCSGNCIDLAEQRIVCALALCSGGSFISTVANYLLNNGVPG